jgi:hypothetical protein
MNEWEEGPQQLLLEIRLSSQSTGRIFTKIGEQHRRGAM